MSNFNEGNNGFNGFGGEGGFAGGGQPPAGNGQGAVGGDAAFAGFDSNFANSDASFTGADPNFANNMTGDQGFVPPPDFSGNPQDGEPEVIPNMFADNENIRTVDFVSSEEKPKKEPKKKKKKGKAILIILAVVLVLAVAAVFLGPLVFMKLGDSKVSDGDYSGAAKFYDLTFGFYNSDNRIKATEALVAMCGDDADGDVESGIAKALENGIVVEVNHNLDGGHFSRADRQEHVVFEKPSDFQTLGTVTKENYSFDGWKFESVSYDPSFDDANIKLNVKADFSVEMFDIVFANIIDADNTANDPQKNGFISYNYETPTIVLQNPTRVGYTFDGWSGTDIDGVSSNVVINQGSSGDRSFTANWTPLTYNVKFIPDVELKFENPTTVTFDKLYKFPFDKPYDEKTANLSDPYKKNPKNEYISRPGYWLKGWVDQSGNVPASERFNQEAVWRYPNDVVLTPEWVIIKYWYKFDLGYAADEAQKAKYSAKEYTVESADIVIENPARFGYTFQGWTFEGQGTPQKNYVIAARSTRDYSFVANWLGNAHKIYVDLKGGSGVPSVINVRFGDNYSIPTPTRTGYTYKGWTGNDVPPSSGVWSRDADCSIAAKWDANVYKVKFNANGGYVGQSSLNAKFDDYVTLPTPTRTGYTFKDWYHYNDRYTSGYWNTPNNVDLTAVWAPNNYTITFNTNGGTLASTKMTVTYDSTYSLPTPTRKGYSFQGWYDGSYKFTNGKWTKDGNLTLTAKWEANTYSYTLDAEGGYLGYGSSRGSVKFDSSYSLSTPTRDGYDFVGWYDGKTKIANSGTWKWDKNLSLSAEWEGKEYTVTLDAAGGKVSSTRKTVVYGEKYTLPTPTRVGYEFEGWYESYYSEFPTKGTWNRTSNVSLEAHWEIIETEVELDAAGGYVSRTYYEFTYGQSYSLPTPTKSGYEFLGWYDGSKKVPSSGTWDYDDDEMELRAKWKEIAVEDDDDDDNSSSGWW